MIENDYRRRGMTPEEAHIAARRAFGGVDQAKEQHRDARSFLWLDDARRDLRFAFRSLTRAPGFAMVAVLTLALGIGSNTAIFSVVRAVLLQPLPFKSAARLVRLYENVPATESPNHRPWHTAFVDARTFLAVRAQSHALSHIVTYQETIVTAQGGTDAARQVLVSVSSAVLPMLGVHPLIGRGFEQADEAAGRDNVLILSYGAWQRYFGGDRNVIGKSLTFSGNDIGSNVTFGLPYRVVGVMPREFHFPNDEPQFWVPYQVVPQIDGRPRRTPMIARLADGASLDTAVAEVSNIASDLRGASQPQVAPSSGPPRYELVRMQDEISAPVRPALLPILIAAVGFVLLIACANVANLLLARTAARQREISIRVAIGAGHGRLIRQALTESLLLSSVGGAAGAPPGRRGRMRLFRVLASSLSRIDLGSTSASFPRLDGIEVDVTVFAFAMCVSVGTGLLFGLAPAVRFLRADQIDALRGTSGPSSHGSGLWKRHSIRGLLVVAETALATLLFVGGGLLIHSFVRLANVELGYDPTNVLTFQVSLPGATRPTQQLKAFAEDLVSRVSAVPGVRAAAYANQLPMVQQRNSVALRTTPEPPPETVANAPDARLVSRDYIKAMGIRVLAGRSLGEQDGAGQPRVLLINQALARRDFGGNGIGESVYMGRDAIPWEIVGVVDDVRQRGLDQEPRPQFFVDLRQWTAASVPVFPLGAYYVLRTSSDATSTIAGLRDIIRQLEPGATLDNVATMDQIVSNSLTVPRMYAVLLTIFASLAVGLAAIGIYGVVSYSVTQRTREIGIRIALGARPVAVLGMILAESAALTIAGVLIGLAGAAMTTRYLAGLLFGLTPLDPGTFVAVSVLFMTVATLASYVPARRATAVDPSIALRSE